MDEIERRSALCAELVKVLIHQETIFSNWIKFAITIEGGLIAGLAFVLRYVPNYRGVLGAIIAFFGVATALMFEKILGRHAQWAALYVSRRQILAPEIFPARSDEIGHQPGITKLANWLGRRRDEIGQQQLGLIVRSVRGFLWLVALAWGVIFVVVLCWRVPNS
jgi:hypothetical protein